MRIFIVVCSLVLTLPAWATRSVTMKGKLESYNDTHFKLREGKKLWKLPLSVMDGMNKTDIAKNVGKEISVAVPLHVLKKGK